MGLSTALNTSLNGLRLNETSIDVLGNNIANAGTNGFKASEALFATQLSRTYSVGSNSSSFSGGTNPRQVGLGASVSQIRRDFTQGNITNSTSPSDMAIQGDGFFVIDSPSGTQYTRAGNFFLNSDDRLVTSSGLRVQGYGVDENFNIITTQLQDIVIPLGDLNVAQATENVAFTGAVYSSGTPATQGAMLTSAVLYSDAAATTQADALTALTSLYDAAGNQLFQAGDEINFASKKGGRNLPSQSMTAGALTYGDLLTHINNVLGVDTTTSGGSVSIVGGAMQINGNYGSVNDLDIATGDLTVTQAGNTSDVNLAFNKTQASNGESTITDLIVYDSLGQPINVKMTTVLETQSNNTTTFRYYLESPDDSDASVALSTGVLTFDGNGKLTNPTTASFNINRANSAPSDLQITIDFSRVSGISTQTAGSAITLQSQDGSDPGTLTTYVIDEGGMINGIFDNGIIRTLGQVVLARFSNSQGLLESGDTNFVEGIASGPPFITTPGNFGSGTVRSGSIELSNTDIGKSLVDLIVASTNYRGNARVIDSVQQLVDELLVLGR
ncbi:flagellar hook protein FlgE [Lacunimicrobium album]